MRQTCVSMSVSVCVCACTRSDCRAGQRRVPQSMCRSQSQLPIYPSCPLEGQTQAQTHTDTHTQIHKHKMWKEGMKAEISCKNLYFFCLPQMWQILWTDIQWNRGTSIYKQRHTPVLHSDRCRHGGNADCNSGCWSHWLFSAPSYAGYLFLHFSSCSCGINVLLEMQHVQLSQHCKGSQMATD